MLVKPLTQIQSDHDFVGGSARGEVGCLYGGREVIMGLGKYLATERDW